MTTRHRLTAALAAPLLLLAACGSSPEDEPSTEPTTVRLTTAAPTAEAPEQESQRAPGAAREDPAAIGETVQWEDYEVTLGETNYDATEWTLQAYADEWHSGDLTAVEPLDDGMVYISAPISLTYVGQDVGEPSMDVTVSYVAADGNVYDMPNSHPAPEDLRDAGELYPGAAVDANIMLQVPADAAGGGVWRLYDTFAEHRVELFIASQ